MNYNDSDETDLMSSPGLSIDEINTIAKSIWGGGEKGLFHFTAYSQEGKSGQELKAGA